MEKNKVEQLIRNLLALSQSSNEHEAALAMQKAQDLLIKHNLDMASIVDKTPENEDESTLINEVVDFDGAITWQRTLLTTIANRTFCKSIKCGDGIHILGRKTNVRAVVTMFNWLEPQIIRIANRSPYQRAEKKSYILGMISTIGRNMDANMEKHTTNQDTRALVICVQGEIDRWYHNQYPHITYGRQSIRYGAFESGQSAGHKVSIYGSSRQMGAGRLMLT